eukprot:7578083-Alexandrium_andersonii.AAC.1
MARAAIAQRGDLRAGAAPLTAPGMLSVSLTRPSGHQGPWSRGRDQGPQVHVLKHGVCGGPSSPAL